MKGPALRCASMTEESKLEEFQGPIVLRLVVRNNMGVIKKVQMAFMING